VSYCLVWDGMGDISTLSVSVCLDLGDLTLEMIPPTILTKGLGNRAFVIFHVSWEVVPLL
jgi:hypothetical protein